MQLAFGQRNMPIAMWIGGGAAGLHGQVQLPANRIIEARDALQVGHIGVVYGGVYLEMRVVGEVSAVELCRAIDLQLRRSFLDHRLLQRHFILRILHVARKMIDVDATRSRGRLRRRRGRSLGMQP